MKRQTTTRPQVPLIKLAGVIEDGGIVKTLSGPERHELHERWLAQCEFIAPPTRTLLSRVEQPGIRQRYEPLLNEEVESECLNLSAGQRNFLDSSLFLNELQRLANNVDGSHIRARESDEARYDATNRLFEAGRAMIGLAEAHLDATTFHEFVKVASAFLCAAAQCGNFDVGSELPKRRLSDHTKSMRQAKKSKTDPSIEKRHRRLRELLDRAPARIRNEHNISTKRREFRAWMAREGLDASWKRSTLIRDVEAVLPLK